MKLPRDLDGVSLAKHLVRHWDYELVRQTGSHMRLRTPSPFEQAITIPAHSPLKPGTLAGVLKTVSEHKQVDIDSILEGC